MTDQLLKQYAALRRPWCLKYADKLYQSFVIALSWSCNEKPHVCLTAKDTANGRLLENDAHDIAYVFNSKTNTLATRARARWNAVDDWFVEVEIPTLSAIDCVQERIEAEHDDIHLE